jgi:hypothetical protein
LSSGLLTLFLVFSAVLERGEMRRRGQGSGVARPRSGRKGFEAGAVRRTLWGAGRGVMGVGGLLVSDGGGVALIRAGCPRRGAGGSGCRSSLRRRRWAA